MARPVSPINSNSKDLAVQATTGGAVVMPRATRAVASSGLDYNVGGLVVGGIGANGDYELGVDPQGALYTLPEEMMWADAGAYYKTQATPGTAIAYSVQTTFSATIAYVLIRNTAGAAGLRVYPDYIRLLCTTLPASATAGDWALVLDPTNRLTSGGTTISGTNTNMRSDIATTGVGSVIAGTPTIAAAGANARTVARGKLRTVIPVLGDTYVWQFGMPISTPQVLNGANPQIETFSVPPVVLAPAGNHSLLLHLWFTANSVTAPQFEVEVGWAER